MMDRQQALEDQLRFLTFLALLLPVLGRFLNLHFLSSATETDLKHVSVQHKAVRPQTRRSQSPG
jgi:hypothetical protein